MVLLIDTTEEKLGESVIEEIKNIKTDFSGYELVDASDMNISHCIGCNYCWLKTPGKCVVRDDYEPLLRKMQKADQVWLISDTKFGFVTFKAKNIVDRVMPLVTMNLHMEGKQMRHVLRYENNPDWGVIYSGEGDREYLTYWCERVAVNFSTKSLGAYGKNEIKEAISCM